eukprot:TRINITY_DN12484_c3_g1_i10.p1 TRINITY_DN12484_c3_g1~~TRINITY_DN12484_c3_g1_i10.p1  ORF type:complete len:630 (+),score=145.25 TRINITY_DN12484_c3_g1_i10:62-1951(+)
MDTTADVTGSGVTDFDNRYRRILVQESHGVYTSTQSAITEALKEGETRLDVATSLEQSARYRATLRSTLDSLHRLTQAQQLEYAAFRQELQAMERSWHLMEIFFLRSTVLISQGSYIIMDLLEWVQTHYTRVNERLSAVLQAGGAFEDHPDFWLCVAQFICQGRMKESAELLQLHSQHTANPDGSIGRLVDLIKRMPLLSSGMSIADFQSVWQAWQQLCQSRLGSLTAVDGADADAHHICELLAGQVDDYARFGLTSWFEGLVAQLLLTSPLVKLYDLEGIIIAEPPQLTEVGAEKDYAIHLAVVKQEPVELLNRLKERFPTYWLPAHVSHLLAHTGWLDVSGAAGDGAQSTTADGLAEGYIKRYAASLVDHPKLWQTGLSYLASLGATEALEAALRNRAADSFTAARKVLHACKQYHLEQTALDICQQYGQRSLESGQTQTALAWFLQANDIDAITRISDDMLHQYVSTGQLDPTDVTGNLGSAVLRNERLTFIDKYKEVHSLIQDQQHRQAAEILINILSRSMMAPKWFHIHVLIDALPLLEQPALVFNVDETHTLLQCLQEIELSHNLDDYIEQLIPKQEAASPRARETKLQAIVAPLRLGLARNLARALLTRTQESDDTDGFPLN